MADYIDTFYNRTRHHSHLGGMSPKQFEATHKQRQRVSTESWELQLIKKQEVRRAQGWLSRRVVTLDEQINRELVSFFA